MAARPLDSRSSAPMPPFGAWIACCTATWHPLRAALLEVEFIDNQTVDELLGINEGYEQVRQDICDAVANALLEDLRRNA